MMVHTVKDQGAKRLEERIHTLVLIFLLLKNDKHFQPVSYSVAGLLLCFFTTHNILVSGKSG